MSAAESPRFHPGQVLPDRDFTLGRDDVRRYAVASGDDSPVHLDDRAAMEAGFPGVVAHGALTLALAGRAVEEWAGGPGRVRELRALFTHPVLVPAEPARTVVTVGGVVRTVEPGVGETLVVVSVEATCGIDRVLGGARAVLAVPGEER